MLGGSRKLSTQLSGDILPNVEARIHELARAALHRAFSINGHATTTPQRLATAEARTAVADSRPTCSFKNTSSEHLNHKASL